eukprot:NODE_1859_length_1584_cov_40.357974_g1769_i0.p1 GENE.NODE_1859_length_1584_cov_40.357974_g1769_i0~~NODE_1859_length_1584_cov_40.357974_g1769_i0.p1  ORF type:complete len:436 (+),score=120.63 NODE_1859_length_1584_cov_40.357974_g1769_i0:60-1367(+)
MSFKLLSFVLVVVVALASGLSAEVSVKTDAQVTTELNTVGLAVGTTMATLNATARTKVLANITTTTGFSGSARAVVFVKTTPPTGTIERQGTATTKFTMTTIGTVDKAVIVVVAAADVTAQLGVSITATGTVATDVMAVDRYDAAGAAVTSTPITFTMTGKAGLTIMRFESAGGAGTSVQAETGGSVVFNAATTTYTVTSAKTSMFAGVEVTVAVSTEVVVATDAELTAKLDAVGLTAGSNMASINDTARAKVLANITATSGFTASSKAIVFIKTNPPSGSFKRQGSSTVVAITSIGGTVDKAVVTVVAADAVSAQLGAAITTGTGTVATDVVAFERYDASGKVVTSASAVSFTMTGKAGLTIMRFSSTGGAGTSVASEGGTVNYDAATSTYTVVSAQTSMFAGVEACSGCSGLMLAPFTALIVAIGLALGVRAM